MESRYRPLRRTDMLCRKTVIAIESSLVALVVVLIAATSLAWRYTELKMEECAWCHRKTDLNRHHVIQQAARPDLKDSQENLLVLCRDCHFVLGHRCNWKQYNPR